MKFKKNNFNSPPIECEFKPHESTVDGEGLPLVLNKETITLDFINILKKDNGLEDKDWMVTVEQGYHSMAEVLGGKDGADNPDKRVIRDWDYYDDNDKEIPVSYKAILELPFSMLTKLFRFCVFEAGNPTKKSETL